MIAKLVDSRDANKQFYQVILKSGWWYEREAPQQNNDDIACLIKCLKQTFIMAKAEAFILPKTYSDGCLHVNV